MKNKLLNLGGILIFYLIIIAGVLLLNLRFSYLNSQVIDNNTTYINN